jgi:hypothetical protein
MGNVSRFVFVDEERSYAARTDQANGDLGWIRVAAFNEVRPIAWGQQKGIYRDNSARERAASPAPPPAASTAPQRGDFKKDKASADSYDQPEADASPGTGWGSNQRDNVRRVDFTPERFACTQVVLRYEYQAGLIALGILPYRESRDRLWERENGTLGFAQPPTRW